MRISGLLITLLIGLCATCPYATAQQITISPGAKLVINSDQRLILEANTKVMRHDYAGAEALYSQAIATNPNNTEAYLQRGFIRREMGNAAGAAEDGRKAVELANVTLQANPNDANAYHQRGMGERLFRDFAHSKADLNQAMQIDNRADWQTDLQAVMLEEKELQ